MVAESRTSPQECIELVDLGLVSTGRTKYRINILSQLGALSNYYTSSHIRMNRTYVVVSSSLVKCDCECIPPSQEIFVLVLSVEAIQNSHIFQCPFRV